MAEVVDAIRRRRFVFLSIVDTYIWLASYLGFTMLRYLLSGLTWQESVEALDLRNVLTAGLLAAALHVSFGLVVRLHQGRSALGSLEEMLALGAIVSIVGLAMTVLNVLLERYVPG